MAKHTAFVPFSSGEEGDADFSWLCEATGEMVGPLADEAFFSRVFLSNGVLTWPNGFDVDAINLHREMAEQGCLRRRAA
ncbi:DUF2442 domain-containing protein [Hoeflea alexandrii]|uniref:DUF2442 domain-containing protein n=1 Tax=Hoeflea alexandrii TaxID=288436 RepID=UPI0035D0AE4C